MLEMCYPQVPVGIVIVVSGDLDEQRLRHSFYRYLVSGDKSPSIVTALKPRNRRLTKLDSALVVIHRHPSSIADHTSHPTF